jgi:hypothetical protein
MGALSVIWRLSTQSQKLIDQQAPGGIALRFGFRKPRRHDPAQRFD